MEIKGITLLSNNEYEDGIDRIKPLNGVDWWWLRSPGGYGINASCVDRHGGIYRNGLGIDFVGLAVRPALMLDSKSAPAVGGEFRFGCRPWTVISPGLALCDEAIAHMAFRKEWRRGNDWEGSDVKKFLDVWLDIALAFQRLQEAETSVIPREREVLKVQLDEGACLPTRAHPTDAGLDLFSRNDVVLLPGEMYSFDTGVHVEIPSGHYGKVEGKSGLGINFSIINFGGVIDEGYTGSIWVKLYNVGRRSKHVIPGDAIAQLVIMPCIYPQAELVEKVAGKERGSDGFGSTGRNGKR